MVFFYRWQLSRIITIIIIITHQGQFVTSHSKIWMSFLKNLHFISNLLCIISLLFTTITKAFKCLQSLRIISVQRLSEDVHIFSECFEVFGKLLEIFGSGLDAFENPGDGEKKNLMHLTQKKLAGIPFYRYR